MLHIQILWISVIFRIAYSEWNMIYLAIMHSSVLFFYFMLIYISGCPLMKYSYVRLPDQVVLYFHIRLKIIDYKWPELFDLWNSYYCFIVTLLFKTKCFVLFQMTSINSKHLHLGDYIMINEFDTLCALHK